jgi:outer membrane protein OmpA-like peptidoglycan-associated protein
MVKGVKKIKWNGVGTVKKEFSIPNKKIVIAPDQHVFFEVEKWYDATTEADKKKTLTWIFQDQKAKTIVLQKTLPSNNQYGIKLPKNLCGPFEYYLEASLSGKRDTINKTGLLISGYCTPKIVSSKWSTTNDGKDVRKEHLFKYGETVHLNLKTEGLNGNLNLSVDVFRKSEESKTPLYRYTSVDVIDGEINLAIKNTFVWFGKLNGIKETEEFYVKVFDPAHKLYISNAKNETGHARFLKINKKIVSQETKPPTNLSPLKTREPDKNAARFEPCKFETITITDNKYEDAKVKKIKNLVFDNGKNLKVQTLKKEHLSKTILFEFEKYDITPKAKTELNNTLQFLLEHQFSSIKIDGHACVIGKEQYNQKLSQQRSDAVKKLFVDGGLDAKRITSIGHGEVNPTDDKQGRDNIKYKSEKDYIENRRVDILFDYYGHDAQTIIYETIAPSHNQDITIDITEYQNKACFREKSKHLKNIKVNSIEYNKALDKVTNKLDFPVRSNLSKFNLFPLQYIWPKVFANEYTIDVHSCRYFSNDANSTVRIIVYPDVKWELALEFLVNVSNYKAANMPAGNIFAKHQEKAREAGYKRWSMNKHGKVPIEVGVKLSAKWDNELHKREYTQLFEKKIESIAKVIAKSTDLLQNAINYAQSVAKETAIPVAFDIRYPKFVIVGKWYLEKPENNLNVDVKGEIGFGFDPLIGAEAVIDIIGAAITALSYGGTGNPAAARIIQNFRGKIETLGGKVTLTATFYGELSVMAEDLKISAIYGIGKAGKLIIGGKFGVTITFEMKLEIGKTSGKKAEPIISFKASAKLDGYFGGEVELNSDEKGIYLEPTLKFSGILFSVEIEGEVGWWKSKFKIEEKLIKEETFKLEKKYFN